MELGRCMCLVLLLSPDGILYLILVFTVQGHFKTWRTWRLVTRLNTIWWKVVKSKAVFLARSFRSGFSVQRSIHGG